MALLFLNHVNIMKKCIQLLRILQNLLNENETHSIIKHDNSFEYHIDTYLKLCNSDDFFDKLKPSSSALENYMAYVKSINRFLL